MSDRAIPTIHHGANCLGKTLHSCEMGSVFSPSQLRWEKKVDNCQTAWDNFSRGCILFGSVMDRVPEGWRLGLKCFTFQCIHVFESTPIHERTHIKMCCLFAYIYIYSYIHTYILVSVTLKAPSWTLYLVSRSTCCI